MSPAGVAGAGVGLQRLLRSRWTRWIALLVIVSLAAVGVIVWRGVPTQQADLANPTVWSVNGRGPLYGQVNTDVTELGAIHAGDPSAFRISGVLQSGSDVVLYSDQQKLKTVDPANPVSVDDPQEVTAAPFDADVIVPSGGYVAFLNRKTGALGAESIGDLARGVSPSPINRREGDETERFVAGAVTERGRLFGLSSAGDLVEFDVTSGREAARRSTDGPTSGDKVEMTVFGEHWAALDHSDSGATLWIDGAQVESSLGAGARLAVADAEADQLATADESGLRTFDANGDDGDVSVDAQGTPAAPVWEAGCLHAAWGSGSAMSVSDCGGDSQSLDVPTQAAASTSQPVFRRNNGGFVLNDVASGLIWQRSGDDWTLVPSSVAWQRDDEQEETTDAQQNLDARQNECPIPASGANAEFGVRPGQLTTVPVLVSALDPNPQDTISIVPSADSPKWDAGGLGDLSAVNDDQAVALSPTATEGSGTIGFVITDGSDCRMNAEAKVTVHPLSENSAPEYRAVNDQSLANLQVAPGGSLRFNGLNGWVDPDGDPVYVTQATASAGTAAATPSGMIAYKADDDQPAGRVVITVEVSDGRGGVATRDVPVTVADSPLLKARSFSRTVTVGTSPSIDLSEFVSGVSGGGVEGSRVELSRATVDESLQSKVRVQPSSDSLSVSVMASEAGVYPVTYEVKSGSSQATATLLITASAAESKMSTPPISVFLRPDEDVTVDPLQPVSNPGGRVLMVGDGQQYSLADPRSSLNAAAVGGSSLRVSGQTPDKRPGRIGTFTYAVTDGAQTITGQATVFQLDESLSTKPVAVADQVTVRAGDQIDIPVLDNDVAPAGGTLMLDPRQTTDDLPGLAFPSGSVLRYLASDTPGSYTIDYRTYSAGHPGEGSIGRVNVRVTTEDGNQSPTPKNIDARVEARSSTMISVPSFGVDADGDDVSVVSVTQPGQGGSAQVLADGRVQVSSTDDAGPIEFDYTVADSRGATGTAHMRVGVITNTTLAPIAYNDYVEAAPGTDAVTIDPTLNDTRVGDEKLELQSADEVVSAAAEGDAARSPVEVSDNTVTLHPGRSVGKTVFTYTVQSAGGSTATGSIVLNVTNDALPQYPVLVDTVIGAGEIDGDSFGADVIANKLVWSGPDLSVELRGSPEGMRLDGDRVQGSLRDHRQIVPISVTAPKGDAEQAPQTWAFVRVPKKDALRPQLKDPTKVYEVHEQQQVSVNLVDEIGRLSGRTLQVNAARASGARSQATCSSSGTTVTYAAGGDSQVERDTCSVEVQWASDDGTRSTVALPMRITLDNPPPEMRAQQIAVVAPAESKTVSLTDSVQWTDDKGKLGFQCGPASGAPGVTVTCSGSSATITVAADAQQGSVAGFDAKIVSPSFAPQPGARLSVQVGTLPPQTLSAAGLSVDVSEGDGGAASGSVDALAPNGSISKYRPVELTGVSFAGAAGVTASISGSNISVQVAANSPGGVKSGTYQVRDAQGNTGQGRIEVNYQARPNRPSVRLDTVGDGTVTLAIAQSETLSVPAVTGFNVTYGGGSKNCAVGGTCTIGGLKNFENQTFTVAAVNDVGSSRETASVSGFAYKAPSTPSIGTVAPSGDRQARIEVSMPDDSASTITLTSESGSSSGLGGSGGTTTIGVNNAPTGVTVTASARDVPTGLRQAPATTAGTATTSAYGVGKPGISGVSASAQNGSVSVTGDISAQGGQTKYCWIVNGECRREGSGGNAATTFGPSDLNKNRPNTFVLQAEGLDAEGRSVGWDTTSQSNSVSATPITFPSSAGTVKYRVNNDGTFGGLVDSEDDGFTAVGEGPLPSASNQSYTIRWRFSDGTTDSQTYTVGPAGTPQYPFSIGESSGWQSGTVEHAFTSAAEWTFTLPAMPTVNASSGDYEVKVQYRKGSGNWQKLEAGATSVKLPEGTATYTFQWSVEFKNQLDHANSVERQFTLKTQAYEPPAPAPAPAPAPEPEPEPGGGEGGRPATTP
ncbi:hypothetical protein F8O07_01220 [Pseudoclavibacter sp. CFCC 13796]|uniref:Ig-like domain-containing protein n=1 Tax=Pseudoclavibacter sp. CFCC 13796 TaxID=2615179 RepID=UPI0013015E2E|nr:Ig-like domain-containing protein [Pseudoclavibacter sp. CFCC 13796]KAB1660636.1 hypothetical protein F8O07_01220 [Pseudoclavibacter sp. CFCC 13796]